MTKNLFAALVGFACALFLWESRSLGQNLSGTSLSVSGTGSISVLTSGTATINLLTSGTASFNEVSVTGVTDFLNNTLYFGTSGTTSALSLIYDDGGNSSVTLKSTRPSAVWNWQRLTSSGTSTTTAMQLDASNRLILTGTAAASPPQLVLDPNGGITVNGSSLLTQINADTRYVFSGTTGLFASNGHIGIGTTASSAQLGIQVENASTVGQTIKAAVSQTSDLQQWQNSSGSVLAVITKDGWLGVAGIAPPTAPFHVNGAARAQVFDSYQNGAAVTNGNRPMISKQNGANLPAAWTELRLADHANWQAVTAYTNGSERLRVDQNGNVGIGTSTPQAALDVKGNAKVSGTLALSGSGALVLPDGTVLSSSNTVLTPTAANALYQPVTAGLFASSGNIGIGTSSPQAALDVAGNAKVSGTLALSGNGALVLPDGTVLSSSNTPITQINADSRYLSSTAGLVVENGNVGIGTSNPSSPLDIQGATVGSNVVNITQQIPWCDGGWNNFALFVNGYSSLGGIRINGADGVNSIYADTGVPLGFATHGQSIVFSIVDEYYSCNTTCMTINPDGNVGIGTSTPQATLDVQGTVRCSGPIRVEPQGDLDMGEFVTEPSPEDQQSLQQSLSKRQTLQSAGGFSSVSSGTNTMTSGTARVLTSGTALNR